MRIPILLGILLSTCVSSALAQSSSTANPVANSPAASQVQAERPLEAAAVPAQNPATQHAPSQNAPDQNPAVPSSTPSVTTSTITPIALAATEAANDPLTTSANLPERLANDSKLITYADGLVQAFRKRDKLAGVVIGVTRKEMPLLLRGYGLGIGQAEPDPGTTMFRVGSTSKLMTYLSAMQLVEQGKLDLNANVNSLLEAELQIPDAGYTRAITVRDLMHHTAGFEDLALGHLFADEPSKVISLKDYLVRYQPNRVREAGSAAVYSNYSVALLGHIVARISGQPYEQYVDFHIFKPLGMTHSSFREPGLAGDLRLSDAMKANLVPGYVRSGGIFKAQKFEYINQIAPAGGLSTTAADMLRFARMLLNDGELDGVRVIGAQTLNTMRAQCFRNGAKDQQELGVQGICHGFMTRQFGAHQAFGHGGATVYSHTAFVTLPTADLAVFVSINTENGRQSAADIADYLVEFLTPDGQRSQNRRKPVEVSATESEQVLGDYITDRRPFSGLTSIFSMLSSDTVGKADASLPKGAITISAGGETSALVPVAPLTYQNIENSNIVKFITDSSGKVVAFAGSAGHATEHKPHGLKHPMIWIVLVSLLTPFSLLTLISAYAGIGTERRIGLGAVKFISMLTALAALGLIGTFAVMANGLTGSQVLFTYPTRSVEIFAWLSLVFAGLTVIKLVCLPAVLKSRWKPLAKLGFVLACLVFAAYNLSAFSHGLLSTNVGEQRSR